MKTYYNLIDRIHTYLSGVSPINTVTFGDLLEVDLSKQTIFPLAHIGIISMQFEEHIMGYPLQLHS